MSNMLRSLARNRAKVNMKNLGMTRLCSDPRKIGSTFASEWRKFVTGTVAKKKRGAKA